MGIIILHTVCGVLAFAGLCFLIDGIVSRHRPIPNVGIFIEIRDPGELENLDLAVGYVTSRAGCSRKSNVIILLDPGMLEKFLADGRAKNLAALYGIEYYLIETSRITKQTVEK